MKRAISAILTAALILQSSTLLPMQSRAADTVYEFENGTIYDAGDHVTEIVNLTGASGGKAVSLLDSGDSVTLSVNAPASGRYTLSIRYCQPYDEAGKYQNVLVNGENIGQMFCAYTGDAIFSTADISANLKEGNNTVTIEASWGWSYLDSLTLSEGKSIGNAGSGISAVTSAAMDHGTPHTAQTRLIRRCSTMKRVISGWFMVPGSGDCICSNLMNRLVCVTTM